MSHTLSQAKVDMSQALDMSQVETPSKRTIFSRNKFIMLHWWFHYTITAKQVNAAIDVFLV